MVRPTTHKGATRADSGETPVAVPVVGTALLLIDVINDLDFDGSGPLVAQAALMAAPLARLKPRATALRDCALTLTLMAMFLLFLATICCRAASGSNRSRTGKANFSRLPPWSGWRCTFDRRWSPESKPVHAPHAETGR